MKRIILIITIVFFAFAFSEKATAQEGIKISLIEYNPETNYARVQIENTLDTDLHNVYFQLNTLPSRLMTPTLIAKTSGARVLNVPPGIHKVTVKSDELTVIKDLSFSASTEEKLEEFKTEQRERKREIAREKVIEETVTKNSATIEEKSYTKTIFIILGILVITGIIAYIIYKKKNENI